MKGMNKVLAVLSLAVILFAVTPGFAVNAAVSESAADRLFYETLCEIFDYEKPTPRRYRQKRKGYMIYRSTNSASLTVLHTAKNKVLRS